MREMVSIALDIEIQKDIFLLFSSVARCSYPSSVQDACSKKLTISLTLFTNMKLLTLLILAVCRTRVI